MERLPQLWRNQESVQDAWAQGRQGEKNETALEITATLENLIVSCSPSLGEPKNPGYSDDGGVAQGRLFTIYEAFSISFQNYKFKMII